MVRKGGVDLRAIQPGDTGIWATCAMKKEAKSVSDLRDLFQEVGSPSLAHLVCMQPRITQSDHLEACNENLWTGEDDWC
jgi:hypothetical protein